MEFTQTWVPKHHLPCILLIPDVLWNGFFLGRLTHRWSHSRDSKTMITWWQTIVGVDGQNLQHSVCKFLKISKFKVNLIHAMDFASIELFSVTYPGLHLVRKCETRPKTYKQTVIMNSSSRGRFFWITWMKPFQRTSGSCFYLKELSHGILRYLCHVQNCL